MDPGRETRRIRVLPSLPFTHPAAQTWPALKGLLPAPQGPHSSPGTLEEQGWPPAKDIGGPADSLVSSQCRLL